MELSRTTRPVAPGTTLTSFDRLRPDAWLRADALSVDLGGGTEGTRTDYLSSGEVSTPRKVSDLAAGHDPGEGRRTVAALNADFFDINETGAPLGPGVRDGEATHSPAPDVSEAVGIGPGAAGRVLDLYFEGGLTLPDGKRKLDGHNAADVPEDGVGAYDTRWGTADRALTTDGAAEAVEVVVEDGAVTTTARKPGEGAIPKDSTVLVGRGAGARALSALRAGDRVSWEYRVRTDGGPVPRTAVGGRGLLVVDGKPQDWEGRPNNAAAPRTAVGFSADGGTMHVLTVDGRQAASGGVTLTELGRLMKELGAHNALNLDGGGSSTLLAREPGAEKPQLENSPSDGEERKVPNGIALTAPEGSGRLTGLWVETAIDPDRAPTADNVPGGHPERVFPGLTRRLTAAGHDETYGPAPARPGWHTARGNVGTVDAEGVFHARRSGEVEVTARQGEATGSTRLSVLGELDRVRPTSDRVGLADASDTGSFGVTGFAADGSSAPIDPADVQLEYDKRLFTIAPDRDREAGAFTVRAGAGRKSASGTVTVTVRGKSAQLAVTVGLRDQGLAEFEDADDWEFSAARASGSLSADPDGRNGQGLRLRYDFSESTATRAAYAAPPEPLPISGQPRSLTLWIKGDGRGAWPSLQVRDATGAAHALRAPHVDWEGWRQVTFEVPDGTAYPLRVDRFYLAETRAAERYAGEVTVDGLVARTPPDAQLPELSRPRDRLISTAADVDGRDWRFAVLSDAQFVAREPDSEAVRQARRTLREIRAAAPDFAVINGDLVDEGSPEDLAFARRLLEEELGDAVPWYYVPGNHEVMGGSTEEFVREFGPARRTFDHRGTRFITLDTSSLTLRGGGYEQYRELRRQLDAAGRDRSVDSVAVISHVPPRDPAPPHASQLTDRMEADLLEDWLGDFRARSGKGAAFIGAHTGFFDASRVNGVPYLINGNAGKAPATAADEGGFTGWSLVGVDRKAPRGGDWLAVRTRAHVDGLTLTAPERLRAGARGEASAEVLQGEGKATRKVPVNWPLSGDWSGSRGLCVKNGGAGAGTVTPGKGGCVATYRPDSGKLVAHRPGTVTLSVEVNGERAERTIRVVR
ncbi:multidrug transporter [Streptomyces sp. AJS327]|nr:phosphodiester glycosidase family protein [Streptomyces sp. AJS327]MBA0050428.1 multidrug transporter [Streptomyces sp. AJS327]